jgi:hypothetical protein
MKFHPFKCARCQLNAAVVGFWCLCQGPPTPEIHLTPQYAPFVAVEPSHYHTTETPIVYKIIMWPAAIITTSGPMQSSGFQNCRLPDSRLLDGPQQSTG